MDQELLCYVNGTRRQLPVGAAEQTLLQWLRDEGYTGTKLGCGEGGCGACTVMVSRQLPQCKELEHLAVNACLCPLYSVIGCHVITVEGIGNARDGLHPVQERLADAHGSQCGFCTPGFVMSMYTLLRNSKQPPSLAAMKEALAGNLCRCTGYRPILDAFSSLCSSGGTAGKDSSVQTNGVENAVGVAPAGKVAICPSSGLPCDCGAQSTSGSGTNVEPVQLKRGCELVFPAELALKQPGSLNVPGPHVDWFRCTDLQEVLKLKAERPHAKLIGGNTEVGIETRVKGLDYPARIDATPVADLTLVECRPDCLWVGGGVTLSRLMRECEQLVEKREASELAHALLSQLLLFAGVQVRNVATVAGNIVTGSPISDLNPLWAACGATFVLSSVDNAERRVAATDFFKGYRKVDLKPEEVLLRVEVPWPGPREFVQSFKQSHRRDDDIAFVNAGMRMCVGAPEEGYMIKSCSLVFGGVGPAIVCATQTASSFVGKPFSMELIQKALPTLRDEVYVAEHAPGGMGTYRTALAAAFLFKFVASCARKLDVLPEVLEPWTVGDLTSAAGGDPGDAPVPKGVQFHAEAAPEAIVGQAVKHRAADLQVTGEAKYTDDMRLPPETLHAALVASPWPHARIVSIDTSAALQIPGVEGIFLAKDIPGMNQVGPVVRDEELFAVNEVTWVGQPVGVAVAQTEAAARRAAAATKVVYEELPSVMSIAEAIEAGSYLPGFDSTMERGDVEAAWDDAEIAHVLQGSVQIGAQEHFYLEPHCNFVQPVENDEYLLWSSTQDVAKHQKLISGVLGIPQHKLISKTKRLGGGFGGKETRAAFLHCATAVAAFNTQRPVRMVLDRQQDMQCTGHRHSFLGRYRVACKADGTVVAVDLELFSNAGSSADLSVPVMDRALTHCDSCYWVPNMRVRGRVCLTNQASHTAFRGFGGPQGMLITNMWMDHVSRATQQPLMDLQQRHLYAEGQATHFGQRVDAHRLHACWEQVLEMADWKGKRAAVDSFNANSRYRKRGLAILPTKFGISFTFLPMNQAGALVNIYLDGSVAVTHGGVEMGQGLHTKMCQVAAQALGVPLQSVHVAETSTDKVPNSSPTAASASSDLYGAAILDACRQLNERLQPLRDELEPRATMAVIAAKAWERRIDMCAHGFYKTPDITGAGGPMPFNYFVYGAAVAEVEVDCLTGDWRCLRADVAMDIGNPINPAIDIGQVEGGFVQGMGWACMEEIKWGDAAHPWVKRGHLLTTGPGNYKIPTADDIPLDFRVKLLENLPNRRAVHSSKAVGEPPFHLGAAVLFALKDAVYASRSAAGLTGHFQLDSPATPERICTACAVDLMGIDPEYKPLMSC